MGASSTPGGVRDSGCGDIRSHFDDAGNERTPATGNHSRRGSLRSVSLFSASLALTSSLELTSSMPVYVQTYNLLHVESIDPRVMMTHPFELTS